MNDKINPAWKPLLDKIPAEFHHLVIPDLTAWDKGVQEQFQKIHTEYEEYKPFKPLIDNNVDADYAIQSVTFADQLQREPAKVIAQVNEAWELGFITKEEADKLGQPAGEGTGDDDLFNSEDDILKNPKVKAMAEALEQLQNSFETEKLTKKQQEEEDAAIAQFESDLDALEAKYTQPEEGDPQPFNRMFVTALMAQGVDGDDAVKQYHEILAGSVQTDDDSDSNDSGVKPPPVMGNGGSVGAGVADGSVDYGKMSNSDFNDTVEKLLAAQANSGQG